MNKDSTDFMLTEYDRISTAYFGLRDQVNEWFKAYLTLVGLPLTVLAAVLKIASGNISISLTNLPDIVSALLILVSFLGFFVTLTIISMRMEMILYARTINGVRRYFANADNKMIDFLILPTSDAVPPFYESWRAMFWQVLVIGIMDGIIMIIAVLSLLGIGWLGSLLIGLVFIIAHWLVYRVMASIKEKGWRTHFPTNLNSSQL
jgi:hypothetical protein